MCNCIEQIEETVRKNNRAESAHILHKRYSEIYFTPLTRKMVRAKHRRWTHADWKYCPFCGEKQ